ncbi:MAG: FemAB family PEP-CTERM system-associated protein [Gammaproteobacteria bacterium]|nr:MAG: FemAB family PEP-CTERM system-associated protein [Gammaproteobacteria bacterium]
MGSNEGPEHARPPVVVATLEARHEAAWEAYVARHPEATLFHTLAWKRVLERTFSCRPYYLLALRGETVCGVLPLWHFRSPLFGRALISVPYAVYGGILADDEEAERRLRAQAVALAEGHRVDYLELRNHVPSRSGWPTKSLYVTFLRPLSPDNEANLKAIPRKQRAMIRKAERKGVRAVTDDDLEAFYAIYSRSVHAHGTPVYPYSFFRHIQETLGEACRITFCTDAQGRRVATVMTFYFRDRVMPYFGGGLPEARALQAFDYMYWDVMARAAEAGYTCFDYGRSKEGTGSYRFKKHWGFAPTPLPYEYHLVRAREMPNVSPANPKYQRLIRAWRALPYPVTRILGPMIARHLA